MDKINKKKILVIAAHPDDEVYGMGGTIAKLSSEGNEVYVLIVTDGCTTQYSEDTRLEEIIEKKRIEAIKANEILGVTKVYFGNLPDMKLDNIPHIEVNNIIETTIREVEPDIVYTHFWGDVNMDHKCVYESTLVATRPTPQQKIKELYCYRVPSSTEWSPQITNSIFMSNTYYDISSYCEQKYDAISKYETELRPYPHPRSIKYVNIMDISTGLKCGLDSAEEFILIRKVNRENKNDKENI